jgi:surface polysaccharide O-acyltransferase-like enzyme
MLPKQRDINIDILRIIAIYAIILIHSSTSYLIYNAFNNGANWWISGVIYASSLKWATGVFVMISGMFLLKEPKTENIKLYLYGRFKRIIVPFLVWALIYMLINNFQQIIDLKWGFIPKYIRNIYNGDVEYHLWFIYMLGVLYLLAPVLSVFVNKAPKKTVQYFIIIWLLVTFIPDYLHQYKDWNFGSNSYLEFSKYSGFFVLGYYLKDYKIKNPFLLIVPFLIIAFINSWGTYILSNSRGYNDYFFIHRLNITNIDYKIKNPFLLIVPFLIIAFINSWGTYILSNSRGYNDYFFIHRLNITNIANTILVFVIFNSLKLNISTKLNRRIAKLSLLSYGIFLNHVLVLYFFRSGHFGFLISSNSFLGIGMHPGYGSLVLFFLTAISSSILAFILSKIPYINRLLI